MARSEGHVVRRLQLQFKLRGLALTKEALQAAVTFVASSDLGEAAALELLLDGLKKRNLASSIVGRDVVENLVYESRDPQRQEAAPLHFIDAFQIPRHSYDPLRKKFFVNGKRPCVLGEATSKALLYRERLLLLQQRLQRNKEFCRPALELQGNQDNLKELTPLQSLLGTSGTKFIIGVISQLEDGRYFLEDLTATVPLDLSHALTTAGFFVENSIVVIEGELSASGALQAKALGFPPLETRAESFLVTEGLDLFGGGSLSREDIEDLRKREREADDDMFIILSDIWLDKQETMEKLEQVFDGYEQVAIVPTLFVLCGPFCSKPCNLALSDFSSLRTQFGRLGAMVARHQRIAESSQFLFIPGPGDPGPAEVLPRPALPKHFSDEVSRSLPGAVFGSNPCRIRWYSQEIVICRQNLLHRMQRACLLPPSDDETAVPFRHLAATVLQESHLCPLPLTSQPIFWEFDHALHLYPAPDVVVLADVAKQDSFVFEETTCINPGSFSREATFVAYRPASRVVELSGLD